MKFIRLPLIAATFGTLTSIWAHSDASFTLDHGPQQVIWLAAGRTPQLRVDLIRRSDSGTSPQSHERQADVDVTTFDEEHDSPPHQGLTGRGSPLPYEHPQSKAERLLDWAAERSEATSRARQRLSLQKHSTPTLPIAELQAAVAADRMRRDRFINHIEWYRSLNPVLQISNSLRERYWRGITSHDDVPRESGETSSARGASVANTEAPWQDAWKSRVKTGRPHFERFRAEQEEQAKRRDKTAALTMFAVRQSQSRRAEEEIESPIGGLVEVRKEGQSTHEHTGT